MTTVDSKFGGVKCRANFLKNFLAIKSWNLPLKISTVITKCQNIHIHNLEADAIKNSIRATRMFRTIRATIGFSDNINQRSRTGEV